MLNTLLQTIITATAILTSTPAITDTQVITEQIGYTYTYEAFVYMPVMTNDSVAPDITRFEDGSIKVTTNGVTVSWCADPTLGCTQRSDNSDATLPDGQQEVKRGDVTATWCDTGTCSNTIDKAPYVSVSKTGRGYIRAGHVTFRWCAFPAQGCKPANKTGTVRTSDKLQWLYGDISMVAEFGAEIVGAASADEEE